MKKTIEIPLSKKKISLLFIGSLLFVVIGTFLFSSPEGWMDNKPPLHIKVILAIGICFFSLCGIFIAIKLFDQRPGLTINQNGIIDNTGGISVGLIEWKDVVGIRTVEIKSSKSLLIFVNNPDKYITRTTNIFARQAMKVNNRTFGSPIAIISSSLKMNFSELESLITSELKRREN